MSRIIGREVASQISEEQFRTIDILHDEVENRIIRLTESAEKKHDAGSWVDRMCENIAACDPRQSHPKRHYRSTPLLRLLVSIIEHILHALEREPRVMLATIISTTGSTPASAFSKMLVRSGGVESVGTVGGGCMEADVLLAARRLYKEEKAEVLTFHLTEDEFVQGLICGGTVEVLIELITRDHRPLFEELKHLREEGEDCVLATFVSATGAVVFKRLIRQASGIDGLRGSWNATIESPVGSPLQLEDELEKAFCRHETRRIRAEGGELILEPVSGSPSLLLFGGGHVSRYVSHLAAMAGFRVTVIDDRAEYANAVRFPEAAATVAADFLKAVQELQVKPSTYIVIVTRGHRYDEEILEWAVQTSARYVGMIGSKRKVVVSFERLVERGVPVEALQRVHAPLGIPIGAATPEEIAVSIVAELISVRRDVAGSLPHKSDAVRPLLLELRTKKEVSAG